MKARIVLLPDATIKKLVKQYSLLLSSKLPTLFTLDDNHIPHVTIMHIDFDEHLFEKIVAAIQKVVEQYKAINVQTNKSKIDESTYLGIYFRENDQIIELRKAVNNAIKDMINSSSTFRAPHITFTRMQKENDGENAMNLLNDFPQSNVLLSQVAIGDSCENGTVSKFYFTFSLK